MNDLAHKPIAISMGEPAGIGPDVVLALFADRHALGLPVFIVYGHAEFLAARAARLGLGIAIAESTPEAAAGHFPDALPVMSLPGLVPDHPGTSSLVSGKVVVEAIARGAADTLSGGCRALVTAPINKAALYATGFDYPGHTEYLASLCAGSDRVPRPVMMLAHEELRVVPLTIHEPLGRVPGLITQSLITETARIVVHDLKSRFGVAEPHIAVTGLNPHAGEGGSIGREDADIIAPTLIGLRQDGLQIEGPFPADTLFYPPHWRHYDAIIAMYHDQALIPIKTVAFESAVNVTLGLPIIRTSPDHGTAYDLAGTGRASTVSMLAALRLADRLGR
jgi:4-hydroxythreonine-4-phosphate dehydrogenase